MPLKSKNPIALKTEDERIRSHRTLLTTVCDNHVYCNSSQTFFLSPSKQNAQYPNITSDNAAHVMKSQTFMQTLCKTLWMLPYGLWLACIIHTFISINWHMQNEWFLAVLRSFFCSSLLYTLSFHPFHQLVFHPPSLHLAIYFLFCLSASLFPCFLLPKLVSEIRNHGFFYLDGGVSPS